MKSARQTSLWIFILLSMALSLQLSACAPAATPAPTTQAAAPSSAPASGQTDSAPPTGAAVTVVPAPGLTEIAPPTQAAAATGTSLPTHLATEIPLAIPETRQLTLDFPPHIRAGDSDVVRLTLEMDENGNLVPTVSQAGNVIKGTVVTVPNLFDTYNVLAEARLDMAGVDIRPSETVSEPLTPRQKITFYWSVLPNEVGNYKGTVWFYLHFIPKTTGFESRQTLSVQEIEIEATSFLGIKANPARWLGVAGTFVSTVLGLPFLESILRFLLKWLRGKPRSGSLRPLK